MTKFSYLKFGSKLHVHVIFRFPKNLLMLLILKTISCHSWFISLILFDMAIVYGIILSILVILWFSPILIIAFKKLLI